MSFYLIPLIILLKGKGKKTKKNKMLKVDARNILGFSVTAAEDRINVGDIDTAWTVTASRRIVFTNSPCDNLIISVNMTYE